MFETILNNMLASSGTSLEEVIGTVKQFANAAQQIAESQKRIENKLDAVLRAVDNSVKGVNNNDTPIFIGEEINGH